MNSILVSGTSGFIGHHLSSRLGNRCTPFDPRVDFDYGSLPKNEITTIIHLGAPSNRDHEAEEKIVDTAKKIFLGIHKCPWVDVIFSSSIRVFGQGGVISANEFPIPKDGYGRGKVTAEGIFRQLSDGRNVDIFRISNVQGIDHRGNYRGVAGIFSNQSKNGKISVNGDGSSVKDIIHVSEVVDSIIWALGKKGRGVQTHCLGRNAISLSELSELISTRTGSEITYTNEDPYDLSVWYDEETHLREYGKPIFVEGILDELLM